MNNTSKPALSAARDLGQFFTDRFICEYMTELCKPRFKSPGVPESVCDPTMGTAGFLTRIIKYFKKHHPTNRLTGRFSRRRFMDVTRPKVAGLLASISLWRRVAIVQPIF